MQFSRWGTRAAVCLHHSPKYSAKDEQMTLENVLRGSGDMGAICDCVWGMRHDRRMKGRKQDLVYQTESFDLSRIFCTCVKHRDFDSAKPFVITGRPYIDRIGDFAVMAEHDGRTVEEKILEVIGGDPTRSVMSIKDQFQVGFDRVVTIARQNSWMQEGGIWVRSIVPF
jgi:hypothetical protein